MYKFTFLAVLEFELKALRLLGTHSTTPPIFFSLVIFQIVSNVYAQVILNHDPPIYISQLAEMTHIDCCTQLFIG
jgi:hypothetical protein